MFCCAAGGRKQSQSDQGMMDVRPTNPRIQPWSVSSPKAITSFILSAVFLLSHCICLDMSVFLPYSFAFPLSFPPSLMVFSPLFHPLSWSPVYGVEFLCWYYWLLAERPQYSPFEALFGLDSWWLWWSYRTSSGWVTYKTNAWVQTADQCHNRYNVNT